MSTCTHSLAQTEAAAIQLRISPELLPSPLMSAEPHKANNGYFVILNAWYKEQRCPFHFTK